MEAGPVRIGGVLGIGYVFTSDRAGLRIQQCVVTLVKARKAYTITLSAPRPDYPTLWNRYLETMLHSFEIADP